MRLPRASKLIQRILNCPHATLTSNAGQVPLYRQSVMYTRAGLALDRSLLAKFVGHSATLQPPL